MDIQDGSFTLAAPASATIMMVQDFTSELFAACQQHDHIVLDITSVKQADLGFVQIVTAAQQHMREKGGSIQLAQPVGEYLAGLLSRAGFVSDESHVDFWFKGVIS